MLVGVRFGTKPRYDGKLWERLKITKCRKKKSWFSNMSGSIFPASGTSILAFRNQFWQKKTRKPQKHIFPYIFPITPLWESLYITPNQPTRGGLYVLPPWQVPHFGERGELCEDFAKRMLSYTLVSEPGKIGPAVFFAIFRSGVYLFELTGFSFCRSRRDLHFPGVILSKSRFSNHFVPPTVGKLTFQRPSHFSRSGVY